MFPHVVSDVCSTLAYVWIGPWERATIKQAKNRDHQNPRTKLSTSAVHLFMFTSIANRMIMEENAA
jgi:hypothetical protein